MEDLEAVEVTLPPDPREYATAEGSASPLLSFVYAIGQIKPRFPSLSVEKEFVQALGRADASGKTDQEAMELVLSDRGNRYLLRHLCWVFEIEGIETYLLMPRDSIDFDLLADAIRQRPDPGDLDVIIGTLGPLAPAEGCGLVVPIVTFDQLYSFTRDELLKSIPRNPTGTSGESDAGNSTGTSDNSDTGNSTGTSDDKKFAAAAGELLDRILQIADNAGATDEHRALNYLSLRYPVIYRQIAKAHKENSSLSSVDVIPSRLRGLRNVLDVIFSFTNRETDVTEKFFVRVDVTEEFPFLVTKLSPYYDR
jgi:hypothetical protein